MVSSPIRGLQKSSTSLRVLLRWALETNASLTIVMNQPPHLSKAFARSITLFFVGILCFAAQLSPLDASPRIKESRLDRSKDDVREPLYTEWMDPFKVGAFVSAQKAFPLYQEINRKGESRVLLVTDLERARYFYYCLMSEDNLVEKNRKFTADGLVLITLSEDADGRFSATWVDSTKVDAYHAKLDELGISIATLKE